MRPAPSWVLAGSGVGFVTVDHTVDWLQSLKLFFINVSYHILVASLTLIRVRLATSIYDTLMKNSFQS